MSLLEAVISVAETEDGKNKGQQKKTKKKEEKNRSKTLSALKKFTELFVWHRESEVFRKNVLIKLISAFIASGVKPSLKA